MPIFPRSRAALLAATLAFGLAVLTPSAALACGGLFCQNTPVDQAGERILFATDGENVTAHVQIQYQGPAKDFSWIVPVPTPPKLSIGSDLLFRRLRAATRPTFRLDMKEEGCEYPMMEAMEDGVANNAGALAPSAASGGAVTVVSQEQVGPFQTAVIQSNDPGALKAWLRDNGYTIPPAIDPLMDPYVAGKYYFLALKLRKDREAGDLAPIAFTYKSTKPGIPIRLTGVAATPDMGVWVWVLGNDRAVPENYRHAEINEARIDWLGGGQNYPQVVTEAMNEAGGQAFVTDYAGKSSVLPAEDFDAAKFDLARVRQSTHPVDFATAVLEGGFFGERFTSLDATAFTAFLARFVKRPKATDASVTDEMLFRFIEDHRAEFDAEQITVDTAAAAAALEEQVVKPLGDIKAMLGKHRYLTSLYTTMSPDEMTQDPMFVFNGQLGDVAAEHVADGLRKCEKGQYPWEAPVRITLKNGISFWSREAIDGEIGKPIAMPAALRIEQLKATGAASLIQDNVASVRMALGNAPAPEASPSPVAGAATAKPATSPAVGTAVAIDPSGKAVAVPAVAPKTTRDGSGSGTTAGGFGCAGCANPAKSASGGMGEGVTFALFALGLAGWRLRARRRR